MDRYSLIDSKLPREMLLLQGLGCRWKGCTFCDYYHDVSQDPYLVNAPVLDSVSGKYGVLDIINSGSAMEFDTRTIEHIKEVVHRCGIHTLWFEAHYMYRHRLSEFAEGFAPAQVKFRCGIESFDGKLRKAWNKGVAENVKAKDVAKYYHGVCLLCCVEGQSREQILNDIAQAEEHFEYYSVNLFCNNTTAVRRDDELARWFEAEVYPSLKDNPKAEVLLNNTDLGVG